MEPKLIGKTIPQLLEDTAKRLPDRAALMVNKGDGSLRKISYGEFLSVSRKLASFIQKKGFEKGAHITILGSNSPEWAIAYFAIQMAGYVVIPIDPALRAQEQRHIIRHSDSVAAFIATKFIHGILEDDGEYFSNLPILELEKLFDYSSDQIALHEPLSGISDSNPAVIIYTSGTTGSPKGVILTHRNIVADIEGIIPRYPFSHEDVFLSVLPVHHSFEATCGFLTPITIGAGICYARALRAKEILEDIQASEATIMLGVPLLFEKFYNGIRKGLEKKGSVVKSIFDSAMALTKFVDTTVGKRSGRILMRSFRHKAGFANLWLMISGGAALRPGVIEFFNHFGVVCAQGYGLSETSPVLTVNPVDLIKPASVGPPIKNTEIRINNPNSEGIGEVQAKGEVVFSEYYKNPEATHRAFTDDGWMKTCDFGRIDDDGYLYLLGRKNDIIVTPGGKNVYPEEIEEKLNNSPFVSESMVIGAKTEKGDEPFAIIVPDFDMVDSKLSGSWNDNELELTLKKVIEEVNKKIAPYKRIKGFRVQQEEFPKTSTRKIKRYLYQGNEINL